MSTRERGVVEATRLTASLTKKPFLSESGSQALPDLS